MTENQLKYLTYLENQRHNAATEEVNRMDAGTRRLSYHEGVRANLADETELHRTNVAKEQETHRANLAKEAENVRSAKASESLRGFEAIEAARANRARETENERTNTANEGIKTWANIIDAFEAITDTPNKLTKAVSNVANAAKTASGIASTS